MEFGSYFEYIWSSAPILFLQEQINDIIIITWLRKEVCVATF